MLRTHRSRSLLARQLAVGSVAVLSLGLSTTPWRASLPFAVQPRAAAPLVTRPKKLRSWPSSRKPRQRHRDAPQVAAAALSAQTVGKVVRPRALQVASLAFFVCVERQLRMLSPYVPLPTPLCGMLGLFTTLLVARATLLGPSGTARLFSWLEPGYRTLVKWGPCFFAPALVSLPVELMAYPMMLEPSIGLRLALLLGVGFLVTFISAAFVAAVLEGRPTAEKSPEAFAKLEAQEVKRFLLEQSASTTRAIKRSRPYKPAWLAIYGVVMVAAVVLGRLPSTTAWRPMAEGAFMLCATMGGFVLGQNLPPSFVAFVHPVLTCLALALLAAAAWAAVIGKTFMSVLAGYRSPPWGAGSALQPLLSPLVVSLGMLLYERRLLLWSNLRAVIGTTMLASIFGLFSNAFMAGTLLQLPAPLAVSAIPRSITSPLALACANLLGPPASPGFAVAMVVITGLIGAATGSVLFRLLRLRSPAQRGLAMGAAAHGLGAVALAGKDPEAFGYSAIAFALCGAFSAQLCGVPGIRAALLRIAMPGGAWSS